MAADLRARLQAIARGTPPPRRGNVLPDARLAEGRAVVAAIGQLVSASFGDPDASRIVPPPELLTLLP